MEKRDWLGKLFSKLSKVRQVGAEGNKDVSAAEREAIRQIRQVSREGTITKSTELTEGNKNPQV